MHYYQFNIGDYRKDTAHLSPIEHYIYRQLIDWYYLDESPIPKKTQMVMRRLCLGGEHLDSLRNVLSDFFFETENGWSHARIDAEIAAYKARAEKNKANGKNGGRPKKQGLTENEKPKKTQSVIFDNPTQSEKNPNYKPITNNQEPIIKKHKQKKSKPENWKPFFEAYPENKKGGTDAAAWKAAQREGICADDLEAMIADVEQRRRLCPRWYSTFAPGITRYIAERIWLTPVVAESILPQGRSGQVSLQENLTDRGWADTKIINSEALDIRAETAIMNAQDGEYL